MTDIDAIRKKHEAYVKDVRPENRFIPSILSCSDVDALFRELDEARGKVKGLLSAAQVAYRKHHLNDDSLGWDEVSDILHNALCNVMGDDGYIKWLKGGGEDE